jgi:hypothetical protein
MNIFQTIVRSQMCPLFTEKTGAGVVPSANWGNATYKANLIAKNVIIG